MGEGKLLPALLMVLVQISFAGMNIVTKMALDSGMNAFVMVTYRQLFATLPLAPFAYFVERHTRPRITKTVLIQSFFCSMLGATLNQGLYFVGLSYSTPTITCALNNLLPAITFVLALPFGLETLGIKRRAGQAKVIGTIICVSGAMFMTFYKGKLINTGDTGIHWKYAESLAKNSSNGKVTLLGPLLVIASCVAWAGWFIFQAEMSKTFDAPYTSTALMCFFATIECAIVGVCFKHSVKDWSLKMPVRAIAAAYNGVFGSAISFFLMSWCITKKGPLYVSAFTPLLLVNVAIFGVVVLGEKFTVGSLVGSVSIVVGLYIVLWGKEKEGDPTGKVNDDMNVEQKELEEKTDVENGRRSNGM